MTDSHHPVWDEAVALSNEGFAVFPVHIASRIFASVHGDVDYLCTCGEIGCMGKHPSDGVKFSTEATRDKARINRFGPRWESRGIGIHLGKSYAWCVDIDGAEGLSEWKGILEKHDPENTFPADVRTVVTGGGGMHLYFSGWVDRIRSGKLAPHIDVKGNADNAYVVAPPTRHHSGRRYSYIHRATPSDAPDWLLSIVKGKTFSPEKGEAGVSPSEVSAEKILERRAYEVPILSVLTDDEKSHLHQENGRLCGAHPVHGSTNGKNFFINPALNRWYCFRCRASGGPIELAAVLSGLCRCDEFTRDVLIKPLSGKKFVRAVQACLDRGVDAESLKKHISGGKYVS